MRQNEYPIKISLIEHQDKDDEWQADCGECHARGKTAGIAVDRLVAYMENVKRLQENESKK